MRRECNIPPRSPRRLIVLEERRWCRYKSVVCRGKWSIRLSVRTSGFHPGKSSSILLWTTIYKEFLNQNIIKMEQTLHLFVTERCPHRCPLCCNKDYPVEEIPTVTVEDIKSSSIVCITGGDPFGHWCVKQVLRLIRLLRVQYRNINKLYVYSSGVYFGRNYTLMEHPWINHPGLLVNSEINGISWGPKSMIDWRGLIDYSDYFENIDRFAEDYLTQVDHRIPKENRLYVFPEQEQTLNEILERHPRFLENLHVDLIRREWQTNFVPAENSIFRRLPILL